MTIPAKEVIPRMTHSTGSSAETAASITGQIRAIERDLPPGRSAVLDLSNASGAFPRAATHTARRVRPGEHRTEAEAALSMFEDACDEPGGELASSHLAAAAIVHALLAIEERLGQ
jgi:hypothetical protein